MNSPALTYAAERSPVYSTGDQLLGSQSSSDTTGQLIRSWNHSRELHTACRDSLISAGLSDAVLTVAVSGSLGRMEIIESSDCDLIVVLKDVVLRDKQLAADCFDAVSNAIVPLGLATSKAGGIFSVPTSPQRLCNPAMLGVIDEDMDSFGHRIQLLIDSQPIFGNAEFEQLQLQILQRYATDTIQYDSQKQWTYLLNDLIRYHRSLSVRTQWATRTNPPQWRALNLKLFHSRMTNYIGLLFLLGESSCKTKDKTSCLLEHLKLTPLERVWHVMEAHNSDHSQSILDNYGQFLAAMNCPDFRAELAVDKPGALPDDHDAYQRIRTGARQIVTTAARFVFDEAQWAPQFKELLLF